MGVGEYRIFCFVAVLRLAHTVKAAEQAIMPRFSRPLQSMATTWEKSSCRVSNDLAAQVDLAAIFYPPGCGKARLSTLGGRLASCQLVDSAANGSSQDFVLRRSKASTLVVGCRIWTLKRWNASRYTTRSGWKTALDFFSLMLSYFLVLAQIDAHKHTATGLPVCVKKLKHFIF
jgi:hypothetical protein